MNLVLCFLVAVHTGGATDQQKSVASGDSTATVPGGGVRQECQQTRPQQTAGMCSYSSKNSWLSLRIVLVKAMCFLFSFICLNCVQVVIISKTPRIM